MTEHTVQSPLPGLFYRRPAPDQPEYVEENSKVSAGQTIGLVEVMKQFVEIKASADGILTCFKVEEGNILGPGDAIATIEVA